MRLFVALRLPEEIKQEISTLRGGIPEARWISDDNAHITLAFIGDAPNADVMDIGLALSRIKHPEFELHLDSVGVFGNSKRPRVLWTGVSPSDPLSLLQQKVAKTLTNLGIKLEDRKFKPHITLARVHMSPYEKVRQYLSDNALFKTKSITIENFTLFSSHLAHSGAIYTEEMVLDLETKELEVTPI
ncbi:MAG: RNA 2',3'-cyclic phosphodiesterase [Sneathiella sp.]